MSDHPTPEPVPEISSPVTEIIEGLEAERNLDRGADPSDDPNCIVVGEATSYTMFNKCPLDIWKQMALPGITIFVHGVNSDGEWFQAAEEGLCAGLNERLKRCDEDLVCTGKVAGQLSPAIYMKELTRDGFINPKMNASNFVTTDENFSPVIHFRYGYKATGDELKKFGDAIFLNEQDHWGGGPFANGCTSIPDLWGDGIEEELFLWLHVQHLNPTADRQVYSCPPRPYFVLAAYRLAKLVEAIRQKQADVPITMVCHSQGNMIGICAAFLGDRLEPAKDAVGRTGRCVADNYVLCNAPYSLIPTNHVDNWSARNAKDPEGHQGRQTYSARTRTLAAFLEIIRERKSLQQKASRIDKRMGNPARGCTAQSDCQAHGLDGSTHGRVTLYCNPHDQVISSSTVQGIGWRGMNAKEIADCNGKGVLTQRVFAQGFEVGRTGTYDFWADHYRKPKPGSKDFWYPHSPTAKYSIVKGLEASKDSRGKVQTLKYAPFFILATAIAKTPINALPPDDWKIPLNAPSNFSHFLPQSLRLGKASNEFDQAFDPPGDYRDARLAFDANDPGTGIHQKGGRADVPQGDSDTQAGMLYEQHAALRMKAKREGRYKTDEKVTEEDSPGTASKDYKTWRGKRVKTMLNEGMDTHATDHSTIMTNPMHAQRVLAYDVAIGSCDIREDDLRKFRVAADWRFLKGLSADNKMSIFQEYFVQGSIGGKSPFEWASSEEGSMPKKIINERQGYLPSWLGGRKS